MNLVPKINSVEWKKEKNYKNSILVANWKLENVVFSFREIFFFYFEDS